jgi:transposase-like protein
VLRLQPLGAEYAPRVIVTDELDSYQVAHRELIESVEHRRSKCSNNRIENSHPPDSQNGRRNGTPAATVTDLIETISTRAHAYRHLRRL